MAVQTGSLGSDSISAWAGHWQLRESFTGPLNFKLVGEFNYASGDSNPADGARGTFDQLYPTGHDKLGLADQVGWRNIRHCACGPRADAGTRLAGDGKPSLLVARQSKRRPLQRRRHVASRASPAVRRRRHVGQEIDLQLTRALTPQILLAGGYAHMFTGPFLEEATPGANYSYPYVMVTYVFLAER